MKHTNKQFGLYLAEIREQQGLTQQELADKINVSKRLVERWENGNSYPTDKFLSPIAEALNIPLTFLLAHEHIPDEEQEKVVRAAFSKIANRAEKNKRQKNVILFLAFIMFFYWVVSAMVSYAHTYSTLNNISRIWNINVSDGLQKVFGTTTDLSLFGEGIRYYVFADDLRSDFYFKFQEGPNKEVEAQVWKYLSELSVPKEQLPDFSHPYLWQVLKKDNERDQFICIFDQRTQRYYFFEELR